MTKSRSLALLLFVVAINAPVAAQPASTAQPPLASSIVIDVEPEIRPATRPPPAVPGEGSTAVRPGANDEATIRGSVFYNDRRTNGLFDTRLDGSGRPGRRCPASGLRDGGMRCSVNALAGQYMVVDVIELDRPLSKSAVGCKAEALLASATVARDGSFVATFAASDPCSDDTLKGVAIELRVRLRFCNDSYCFSINRKIGQPYALPHPQANAARPLNVRAGSDITMAAMTYGTATDPSQPDDDSIAANYYASIVDTVLTLHKDQPIPFLGRSFGELQYLFPSDLSDTATARSASLVAISTFESRPEAQNFARSWIHGKTPAHEYGHVLMLRAWGGNYGFDGMGISASGTEIAPSRQIAFKEAWAEFVARVVFPAQRGCQLPSYDDNGVPTGCKTARDALAALEQQRTRQLAILPSLQGAGLVTAREQLARLAVQIAAQQLALDECQLSQPTTTLPGPLSEGAQWRDNVAKALCDWYDQRADDDLRLPGPGDHFAITDIHTMWRDLRDMKANASSYSSSVIGPGLWFCDFVAYYLNVRQSVAVVGAATHDKQKILVRNLLSNNNIACPATAS